MPLTFGLMFDGTRPDWEKSLSESSDPQNQLVLRVFRMLKEVFPESAGREDHFFEASNRPLQMRTLFYILNPKPHLRALKFAVGTEATTAMLVIGKSDDAGGIGLPRVESRSVGRDVLANDCWDAFIGWVSYVKEIYEKEFKP